MSKIAALFLLLFLATPALCQSVAVTQLEEQFYKYHADNYLESVFIHTDKDFYLTGETVHFSVFCLESLTSKPSQLSKVAYVDVVDSEKKTILTSRVELVNGTAGGEVYIPTSISSGYFTIRGYTQWMRNYGPASFYHSVLTIINPFKKLPPLAAEKFDQQSVSFFPEGGIILEDVQSKIVFHGKSALGQSLEFSGTLMNEEGSVVCSFKSIKNGLGSFQFVPEAGRQYIAEIQLPDGTVTRYPLPSVEEAGISLRVVEEKTAFRVNALEKSPLKLPPLTCLVHQGAAILFKQDISNTDNVTSFAISKSQIKAGVFTVSLFRNSKLMAQRIGYYDDNLTAEEGEFVDKKNHAMRESFALNLENVGTLHENKEAVLSVSVSEKTPDFLPAPMNMRQWLLLQQSTANLFGSAAWFDGTNEDVSDLVNNLLIAYPQAINQWFKPTAEQPRFLPEYRGPLATGHIFNKVSGEPAAGITTYLSVPGRATSFFASNSIKDGSLAFELQKIYGENEMVVQTDYTKDTTYRIEIDSPFSKEYLDIALPPFSLSEQSATWLLDRSQQMQVVNAYHRFNPSSPVFTSIDSSAFYHNPDASYLLDNYTRFVVMEEVMREYVAGVNVRKTRDGFYFMVVDIEKNIVYEHNPLMLLDGVPVFDADEIIALDPLKIQRIETVRRRFGKGIVDCEGIVNYTTYKGDLAGYTLNPGALVFKYDGVQVPKRLPEVKYTTPADTKSRIPDFRTTLYWNGNLSIDKGQKTIVGGYTSDATGSYKITINALTANGKVISIQDSFQVH